MKKNKICKFVKEHKKEIILVSTTIGAMVLLQKLEIGKKIFMDKKYGYAFTIIRTNGAITHYDYWKDVFGIEHRTTEIAWSLEDWEDIKEGLECAISNAKEISSERGEN